MPDLGVTSRIDAPKVAARVWGRDEDGVGVEFSQGEIDKVVEVQKRLLCVPF
jgi:hypothetical protein